MVIFFASFASAHVSSSSLLSWKAKQMTCCTLLMISRLQCLWSEQQVQQQQQWHQQAVAKQLSAHHTTTA